MNNKDCANSEREQNRVNYDDTFLMDLAYKGVYDHEPRNHIGINCGINYPRALEIFYRRISEGTL